MTTHIVQCGDCLDTLRAMPTDSVDSVLCSPPYSNARSYGIDFHLKGEAYVKWCFDRYIECIRVSRGLVAWVIEGRTEKFRYDSLPYLLQADLHRAGVKMRKPLIFHRVGIAGSGGPDYLRSDTELILCASKGGKLKWSNNTACGHPPKYGPGGAMSYQTREGRTKPKKAYQPPAISNPGNVIYESSDFTHHSVGGGQMGHDLAHANEAPFPLSLASFYVQTFCQPGGTILDCFGGSGTTAHAAMIHGRSSISIDIRESQCEIMRQRLSDIQSQLPPVKVKLDASALL